MQMHQVSSPLYADIALLLPKGRFFAEIFCIKFLCISFVQKSEYAVSIEGSHPDWVN